MVLQIHVTCADILFIVKLWAGGPWVWIFSGQTQYDYNQNCCLTEESFFCTERLRRSADGKRRSMSSVWKTESQSWRTRIRHWLKNSRLSKTCIAISLNRSCFTLETGIFQYLSQLHVMVCLFLLNSCKDWSKKFVQNAEQSFMF